MNIRWEKKSTKIIKNSYNNGTTTLAAHAKEEKRKQNDIIINTVCPHCPLHAASPSASVRGHCRPPWHLLHSLSLSLYLYWRCLLSSCALVWESQQQCLSNCKTLYVRIVCAWREAETYIQTTKERRHHSDSKTVCNIVADCWPNFPSHCCCFYLLQSGKKRNISVYTMTLKQTMMSSRQTQIMCMCVCTLHTHPHSKTRLRTPLISCTWKINRPTTPTSTPPFHLAFYCLISLN